MLLTEARIRGTMLFEEARIRRHYVIDGGTDQEARCYLRRHESGGSMLLTEARIRRNDVIDGGTDQEERCY